MNKIKLQFSELRKSTPKYVQWLLLAAAFIVVLILLTLVMTGSSNNKKKTKTVVSDTPLKLTLSEDSVDWVNVDVGTKKEKTISVNASAPAKVSMSQNKNINGFNATTTCTAAVINDKISCRIFLSYEPTVAAAPETLTLYVYYHGENDPEEMKASEKITVILGAVAPIQEQPTYTQPEPVYDYDDLDDYEEPDIRDEIETIAPNDPFADAEPLPTPTFDIELPKIQRPSESCSDFAFPGYGPNGTQIGWIKPDAGSYFFYPFADKECKNPTGIYNPSSVIITDINGNGNRIGTDAEHIGYAGTTSGTLPALSDAPNSRSASIRASETAEVSIGGMGHVNLGAPQEEEDVKYASSGEVVTNTIAYDRTFVLRQYNPIPATIVSDVRADPSLYKDGHSLPVRATVDRNVYADNGRTVIIPTGTLLLGYLDGTMPGPYTAIGRMEIKWYQFVLPNGVEFNFQGNDPFSGDAQGRVGVPGRGSTDYLEQFVMPMLTAIVPAAVNMIAPVADKFVNQIDLDNNTVVQSGTMRSSELAKNEIITAWNQVAQKLLVDMMDNTVPPFSIPAGTRITVYSPADLQVTCGAPGTSSKKCAVADYSHDRRATHPNTAKPNPDDGSWVGQARSFALDELCIPREKDGVMEAKPYAQVKDDLQKLGYSYSTLVAYCQASNYQAINNARQAALYQNQQDPDNKNSVASTGGKGTQTYNEQVLGLKYNEDGSIKDPFKSEKKPAATAQPETNVLTCDGGILPDQYGCCPGEEYTDMGDQGFNCCPTSGGDCFPPINN